MEGTNYQGLILPYPGWLKWSIIGTSVAHDLAVIVAGVCALLVGPPTSIAKELQGDAEFVWIGLLILGGVVSLVGVSFRSTRLETTGCVMAIGGKLVWVVAALTTEPRPPASYTFAALLIAGVSGTLWRVFGLLVGVYLRTRK